MAKKTRRRIAAKAKPTANRTGRRLGPTKPRSASKGGASAGVTGASGDSPHPFAHWLPDQLVEIVAMATDYQADFLKSRRKDRLNAGVRTRITKKLDAYVNRVDQLRRALRSMPDGVVSYIRENGQDRTIDILWTITEEIAVWLDRMHESLARQRAKIAAPMTPEEVGEFWAAVSRLAQGMESLRAFAQAMLQRIAEVNPEGDERELGALTTACKKLCEAIGCFGRRYAGRSRSGRAPNIPDIQAAAEEYRRELVQVSDRVEQVLQEMRRSTRAASDPIASDSDELVAGLGFQQLQIDAACYVSALGFDLPHEADACAREIRSLINPALRDNMRLAAKLDSRSGDEGESSDLAPESSLPEYTQLATEPAEQAQLGVIVDCLLAVQASSGPSAMATRKVLVKAASRLADFRGVTGMGATNVWNKLHKLIELKVVRKFEPNKSQENPNASGGYRLTIPAQARYAGQAEGVRAELARMAELHAASRED